MSFTVNVAHSQQFGANVLHLVQQAESRLADTCREETMTGDRAFFDRLGIATLVQKTARHQDTPHTEIEHTRRMVVPSDYLGNEYTDKEDEVRMLIDPKSQYAKAFAGGIARLKDQVIIDAATGTAATGQTGTGTESFDTTNNRVAVNYVESGSAANSNLTVAKVRRVAMLMNVNEVPQAERFAVISASQLNSLQRDDEFTSRDYNVIQPLANGDIPVVNWMGFTWRRSEQIGYSSGSGLTGTRRALFYHKDGLLCAMARNPVFRVAEAAWKNFAWMIHVSLSIGAVRMEQNRVYEVLCDQSA